MRLLEYESKQVFRKYGLPLVASILIEKPENIDTMLAQFSFPAIVKSQIAIGGRGKAGLIKIAHSREEAKSLCTEFFQREIAGFRVKAILIESLVNIKHEYYVSVALDTSSRQFFVIASAEGGVEIETVAKNTPEKILKIPFDLNHGLTDDKVDQVVKFLNLPESEYETAKKFFHTLWDIAHMSEATLVEVNPLVLAEEGLFAVDGKMILDEDADFRQPDTKILQQKKLSELEKIAKEAGFSFVELDGEVGILANGAGLTLALLDVLTDLNLKPANFLDVGGGASKERVFKALELLFKMNPKGVLINIYGGITRCDVVAEAVIEALKIFAEHPPMVIRLTGTKEKEGVELLHNAGMDAYADVLEAVNKLKEILEVKK
ncbi:MAG: ADP-forming succinate--CoA ligase subunit beta [Promethearchaeota archaeon]|nr:MAG: ADP-forming succinate--CoA ligase subunit beta [Candidatus Lokiarchaeota archaeon]